jgi:hypothetical protein
VPVRPQVKPLAGYGSPCRLFVRGRCQQARFRALRYDELATTATADPDDDVLGNGSKGVSIRHISPAAAEQAARPKVGAPAVSGNKAQLIQTQQLHL